MTFEQAEAAFRELQAHVRRGAVMSRAEFESKVQDLAVVDDRGVAWEIHPQSCRWMYFDGSDWIPGTPPGRDQSGVMLPPVLTAESLAGPAAMPRRPAAEMPPAPAMPPEPGMFISLAWSKPEPAAPVDEWPAKPAADSFSSPSSNPEEHIAPPPSQPLKPGAIAVQAQPDANVPLVQAPGELGPVTSPREGPTPLAIEPPAARPPLGPGASPKTKPPATRVPAQKARPPARHQARATAPAPTGPEGPAWPQLQVTARNREWILLTVGAIALFMCGITFFVGGRLALQGLATAVPTLSKAVVVAPTVTSVPVPPTVPPTVAPTATAAPITAVVIEPRVNVRSEPSTQGKIVGKIQKDDTITLIARSGDSTWYQATIAGIAQPSWVFGATLKVASGDPNALAVKP